MRREKKGKTKDFTLPAEEYSLRPFRAGSRKVRKEAAKDAKLIS
jgi:hypothetical protein